jgi:hypothetical protein
MLYKLLMIVCIVSCSNRAKEQPEKGHSKLYSQPEMVQLSQLEKDERRVILVATNDLQGQVEVQHEVVKDKHSPQEMMLPVGGVETFDWYLSVLRKKFPNQVLLVDSGQWLTGSLIAEKSRYEAMFYSIKKLQYDALGLGSNDFLAFKGLGSTPLELKSWMKDLLEQSQVPIVVSNVIDLTQNNSIQWGKTFPHIIKDVNGTKVGIIGAISPKVVLDLDPQMTSGLYFEKILPVLLWEVRKMKALGADAIVLLLNSPLHCGLKRSEELKVPISKVNFNPMDPQVCAKEGEIYDLIARLPPNLVDVIVGGGASVKVSNRLKDIDILQSFGQGKYFSWMELVINPNQNRVVKTKTQLFQPIKICHQFFNATKDCYSEDKSVNHSQLTPAQFLEQIYTPTGALSTDLSPYKDQVVNYLALPMSVKNFRQSLKRQQNSVIVPSSWWKKVKSSSIRSLRDVPTLDGMHQPLVKLKLNPAKRKMVEAYLKNEKLVWINKKQGLNLNVPLNLWKNKFEKIKTYLGFEISNFKHESLADAMAQASRVEDAVDVSQSQKNFIDR